MKTPGIRRGMAFILVVVCLASYYLYDRFVSVKEQGALSGLLYQMREQDIQLDRDVERIVSFRLPHYDSLVKSSKNIKSLAQQVKQREPALRGWIKYDFKSSLEDYLAALAQKRLLIERIQSDVALVRNSLLYLPTLLEAHGTHPASHKANGLVDALVVDLYSHYLFPDKLSEEEIQRAIESVHLNPPADINTEKLLKHMKVSLLGIHSISKLKQDIESLDIESKRKQLRKTFVEYRRSDDRNAILLGVVLLCIVFLLMAWLWRTLVGLGLARRASERAHYRLQDAVESLGEAFALFDSEQNLILHNNTFKRFYPWLEGYLKPGMPLAILCNKNSSQLSAYDLSGKQIFVECHEGMNIEDAHYIERIGKEKWYLASNRMTTEGGVVCVRTDITDSRKTEQQLQKLGRALDQSPTSIVITDINGVIEYVNPKFEEVSGYSAAEAIGQRPSILKSGEKSDQEYAQMWKTLKSGKEWQGVFHNKRKDGSLYWESARISPVRNEDGEISYFIGIKEDITQQRQNEEQIRYQANFDLLTGLPNRTLLMERLRQNIMLAKRGQVNFAVLFVDLDRFKAVNDLYGHVAGDSLMKMVARRLKEQIRETDTVARLGGDEFVMLLPGADNADAAAIVARKIIDVLSRSFELDGRKITIGASVGITLFPVDVAGVDSNVDEVVGALLSNADMAMYQAKARGRNHYHFFEQEMQNRVKRHVALEQDLKGALKNGELEVYYQPLIDAYSSEMIGMEALMRWQHPKNGMIAPGQFIALAEESGVIGEMGEWIFMQSCQQVYEWQKKYQIKINLSVNLSARQRDKGFDADSLMGILRESRLDPQYLMLEITENLLLKESDQAAQWLCSLKDCGVKLAVDDFGTGYSSLSYLKNFPVDVLKIDRSFIKDIPEDKEDISLVTAIVAMADSLGIGVIAEGVETEEQRQFLKDIGCDYMQGFLFDEPLSAEDMEMRIANPVYSL
jgi:diguanylate cyclase (GGDEF)-like protein/PAS domain S-box-containing protein